jgi:hypothetical protein
MINVKFYGILNKTLGKRKYKNLDELKFFVKYNIYPCKIIEQKKSYAVLPLVSGEGGGKGKGSPPTPLLKPPAPDENSLQSFSQSETLDLICEGPIEGFCDSNGNLITNNSNIAKGVYFNGTVVQNANDTYNYRRLALNYVKGDHKGINPYSQTHNWSRSKIYNTQSIKQKLVGPNMASTEDGAPRLYGGGTPNFAGMVSLMQQSGESKVKSDFNTSHWYQKNGAHIGYFLGGTGGLDNAIKYGYAASQVEHGSDIRTHTSTRDFTAWSAGHSEFTEGGFPVSHTIKNNEVDFAYITISIDDLKDTVDHGAGAGKVGIMTTSREHKVGFQVEIGVNGLTDEEAQSPEFKEWLSHHGFNQSSSNPRRSISRNYFVQGLVAGSSYLVDVGRASFGADGEVIFGEDNDFDEGMNSIDEGTNPAAVFDASDMEALKPDQSLPHNFAPSQGEAALGLNRFQQFGENTTLRDYYERGMKTFFMPMTDANNAFNCFRLPPSTVTVNEDKISKTRYIKVTRTGRELISPIMSAKISLDSVTEIIDEKIAYPYSAIIQQSFNSRYFSEKPERTYHLRLKKILIPSNYNPDNRSTVGANVYNGAWDGTFKYAWSDNPAWVLYDLMTNNRYGIGAYLDINKIDKWTLYRIGRYCDAVDDDGNFVGVDDTYNGKEPRYSMNVLISEEEEAYELLKTIAETFHGIAYWDGRGVSISMDGGGNTITYDDFSNSANYVIGTKVEFPRSTFNIYEKIANGGRGIRPGVDQDWKKYWNKIPGIEIDEPAINFSNTNVEGGTFSYFTSSKASRYTVARVGYMDKTDSYRKKYEYVEDKQGVKELGVIRKNIEPLGCTSRGQARRMGRWFFLTSSVNTETITFSTDYRALFLKPGNIIGVTDTLKNTNQSIGKIVDVEGTETLVLTHPISVQTRNQTTRQNKYYDIILGNIDPSYNMDFLDNKGSVTGDDIANLNKAQRLQGSIFPADGSSTTTNKIKVKDLQGNFLKFTNSLLDSYDNGYNVVSKGTDWALVNPTDGGEYSNDWQERKYRIQAIEEEGEGKYKVIAVLFDEEKLSSMDQTFPVISSNYEITLGDSAEIANATPPVVEKFKETSSSTLTFKVKFSTTIDESKFNSITNNIILSSPNGTQTTHNNSSRNGGGTKEFTINTGIAKTSSAASGVWSVYVTTTGIQSSTSQSKTSAAGILSRVIADASYSNSPPGVLNVGVLSDDGQTKSNYNTITAPGLSFDISWEYQDIDGGRTQYDSISTLLGSSPFFEGFRVGLCPVDRSGLTSARSAGTPQTTNVRWIYGDDNLLNRLSFSFNYERRFDKQADDDGVESFIYSNLQDERGIAVVVQAVARAGNSRRYSSRETFIMYDPPVIYTPVITSIVPRFIPNSDVFYDLNKDKTISIIVTDDDGNESQSETSPHGKIPDGAVFDFETEASKNSNVPSRIYSVDEALALWTEIKNNTINSNVVNQKSRKISRWFGGNAQTIYIDISYDNIKLAAEAWEEYQYIDPKYGDQVDTHWENFTIVNYAHQEEISDTEMVSELGDWTTEDIVFNDANKQILRKNLPEGAGANTLSAFESMSLFASGSFHKPSLMNPNRYLESSAIGYMQVFIGKDNPDYEPAEDNLFTALAGVNKTIIPYDDELEDGINYDNDFFVKLKIWDYFDWNNSSLDHLTKLTEIAPQEIDFGVTGFMVIPEEDLADLASEDEEDATVEELGHAFINTFGDERLMGMKQFREGLIIGGTETWSSADGAQNNPDSFVKYPLGNHVNSYQGTPVGIGQYNLENVTSKTYQDLLGEGDSSNQFALTKGELNNDMLDFHVNIKGMNIRCVPGDNGNYDGVGGVISGQTIKTNGFEAGEIVAFSQEPTINGSPMSTYFSEGEGISGKIDEALNNTNIFDDKIQDTNFTENLVISGDSRLKVEDGNLHIEVNGIWYRIEPDGTS